MRKAPLAVALLGISILSLVACSGHAAPAGGGQALTEAKPRSLPAALDNAEGLQTMAEALKVTGVAQSLQGNATFTLLAPEDDAFADAGAPDGKLMAQGDHAALAALVRNHMLPGHLTPKDLGSAIDASPDGEVTVTSLGGEELTFRRTGRTIAVTAPDGSHAMLDGDPVSGGSSIAIPISGVLQKIRTDAGAV